ncbi:hypothetical protein SAMN05444162_3531 [Paenibacillaceae bacterium GAS479]|nr:hypothetical protein SAMN05444162_3531 [Paenibacillaceae bacterium GAS479]
MNGKYIIVILKGSDHLKKVIAGGFILLSGVILYVGIHISTVPYLSNVGGWSTPPRRFGKALQETDGYMATIISIIMIISGIIILLYESYFSGIIKKYVDEVKERNLEFENEHNKKHE